MSRDESPFALWHKRVAISRIRAALVRYNGNRAAAARALGLPRQTFTNWLKIARRLDDDRER